MVEMRLCMASQFASIMWGSPGRRVAFAKYTVEQPQVLPGPKAMGESIANELYGCGQQ